MDSNPLGDLLLALCERTGPGALAETLGGAGVESAQGGAYLRVTPTRFAGVEAVDVQPWTTEHFGWAVIESSPDWTRADVERMLGPLEEMPIDPGGPPFIINYRAIVDDPRLPARAVAYATFADSDKEGPHAALTSLEARVESMEKYR